MYLTKPITTAAGVAVSHHAVQSVSLDPAAEAFAVLLASWPSELSRADGHREVARWHVSVPVAAVAGAPCFRTAILDAIVASDDWDGAVAVLASDPAALAAEDRRRAQLKAARNAREFDTFAWDGSLFDGDRLSQSRIVGGVLGALVAHVQGQPFQTDWTLADNTSRPLDGVQMLQLGQALFGHITGLHSQYRALVESGAEAWPQPDPEAPADPVEPEAQP